MLTCEYNVAKFHLKNPSQKVFMDNFPTFLNSNLAQDFDKWVTSKKWKICSIFHNFILLFRNKEFRRASVLHFGCALTVSNSSNIESYFVCVYCSKEKSVSYTKDNCLNYTTKNENLSEFPNLCEGKKYPPGFYFWSIIFLENTLRNYFHHFQAPKYIDLYGCEPKKICDSNPPEIWTKRFPGELEQFYVVTEQETWLVINRTIYEVWSTYSSYFALVFFDSI